MENANPAENAPIMNASPNISASPEHNSANPKTMGIFASTEPILFRNLSMYFDVKSPMPVSANQNIIALAPIVPTDHISTLPDILIPTIIDSIKIPRMSSITAAAMIVVPSEEFNFPISANTLAVIPTDVAVKIEPMNNASRDQIPPGPAIPKSTLEYAPRKKGNITPPKATIVAGPEYFKKVLKLVSNPTANNNIIDPICATENNSLETGNAPGSNIPGNGKSGPKNGSGR